MSKVTVDTCGLELGSTIYILLEMRVHMFVTVSSSPKVRSRQGVLRTHRILLIRGGAH